MGSGDSSPSRAARDIPQGMERVSTDPPQQPDNALDHSTPRFTMDVIEQDNQIVVRAQVTAMNPEELEVRITDKSVTVRGERKRETGEHNGRKRHRDRSSGDFSRRVSLPHRVDIAQAKATFLNGLLEITAPKHRPEGRRGRKLAIERL